MTQPAADDEPVTYAHAQPAMASAVPVPDDNTDNGDTGNED